MAKVFSEPAIKALKEALCRIYWYKSDLQSFLRRVINDPGILGRLDWDLYKRQIASDAVDLVLQKGEGGFSIITALIDEVCAFASFPHLEKLEDGRVKAESALAAVSDLKELLKTHTDADEDRQRIEKRRRKQRDKLDKCLAVQEKLDEVNAEYIGLIADSNHQKRGFRLEKVMRILFEIFDLDPRASFRNTGEQIDGAFTLDGTEYLFEAKWRNAPSDISDLDAFDGKIGRKLENTLGLFLSINGFSAEAISLYNQKRPSFICMSGADLMAVLEKRIDFVSLLANKKRYAAQSGIILYEIHEMG